MFRSCMVFFSCHLLYCIFLPNIHLHTLNLSKLLLLTCFVVDFAQLRLTFVALFLFYFARRQVPLFYAQQVVDCRSPKGNDLAKNTDVFLDPNHTHFILVDDGSEGQFGKEIEFRAHLEAELRRGRSLKSYEIERLKRKRKQLMLNGSSGNGNEMFAGNEPDVDDSSENEANRSVPMILIVVQGGPNTLITVEESLKQNVPVLVLADSKGCADLIANACLANKPEWVDLFRFPVIVVLMISYAINWWLTTCFSESQLEKLIIDCKMFESIKDPLAYKKKVSEARDKLKYIVSRLSENLINVFRLDSEEGGSDIELTILRAFLNCTSAKCKYAAVWSHLKCVFLLIVCWRKKARKNNYYENLKLALQWNRDDIAKSDIFTGEEEFSPSQLAQLMEMTLIQNKPKFVELLLENGLNLKSFLTRRRLLYLFNSQKIQLDAKKAPLFQLYKKKYSIDDSSFMITFKGLQKFLKDYLFKDFEPSFLPNDLDNNQMKVFLVSNQHNKY